MVFPFDIIDNICLGLHQGIAVYVPEGPGGVQPITHPGDLIGEVPAISVLQPGKDAGGYIEMAGYGGKLCMACK